MQRSPVNKSMSNPDLHATNEPGTNVTQRKRKQPDCELTQAINSLSSELRKSIVDLQTGMADEFLIVKATINKLREEFNTLSTTSTQIQKDFQELRTEYTSMKNEISNLNKKHVELSKDVACLKSTVDFNSNNYKDYTKRLNDLELKMSSSAVSTVDLLERKIDSLEQQARICNIEIANIPEKRNESLISILGSIGSAVNISITPRDIKSIHRVPHAHELNNRPKNIIVKFTSRIMRDNILTAYRLSKGLTSDRVGLPGTPFKIYMNEHLTLRNKQLFRKCREAAKSNKYKFVWVRNTTILVKESEDSATFAIRTEDDIFSKIKLNSQPTTSQEASTPNIS